MHRLFVDAACAAVFAVVIMVPAAAQAPTAPAATTEPAASFTLDAAAAATLDVTLTVQTPATIPLKIIRSGGPVAGNVSLDVSYFANDQGSWKPVTISVDGAADSGKAHLDDVSFAKEVLAVDLHVPDLPAGGKYTGRLILTPPKQAPVVWRFFLTSANDLRPATLVLDQNAVTLAAVRLCPWCGEPALTIHARDKSGNWPLDGVTARLEPGLKFVGPGFGLEKQLSVKFDGADSPDFFSSPASGGRNVAAHGQATITIAFTGLDAGEYTIPLRITAKNSGDDDLQRLTVTLQVRDHWWIAALVLLFAGLTSFLATRVVTGLRQRAQFLTRLRALRPAWLGDEPPILPVTWLRATLRQTEFLSNRYLLSGQSEIDTRLNGAAGMLGVLDRMRQVREHIEAVPDPRVKQRAMWKFDAVVKQIPAASLTEEDVARFTAELSGFNVWFDADLATREAAYWADLLAAVRARYAEVQITSIPARARELANRLHALLGEVIHDPPQNRAATLQDKIAVQDVFERLSILWESRGRDAWAEEIVKLHPANREEWAPLERIYKVIDDGWWQLLKTLPAGQRKVEAPSSTLDPIEAYETVVFKLKTETDPGLLRSYLVQKKLKYEWTIEVFARQGWGAGEMKSLGTLKVESTQPQVAQYSPKAGGMKASVRIVYDGDGGPTVQQDAPVPIRGSGDFRAWRISESADMIAFFAALLASVVSGVALYALTPTFGGLKDFIALFTWGAGIDQGKNFLQSLAANATPAPAAAPTAPPGHAG
jgi:hypothetical protein